MMPDEKDDLHRADCGFCLTGETFSSELASSF